MAKFATVGIRRRLPAFFVGRFLNFLHVLKTVKSAYPAGRGNEDIGHYFAHGAAFLLLRPHARGDPRER